MDEHVAWLQDLQIGITSRVVRSLMDRVQARGSLVVKGKLIPLRFPSVMVHIEARDEMHRGGYVMQEAPSLDDLRARAVLEKKHLPPYAGARAYACERLNGDLGQDTRMQLIPLKQQEDAIVARVRDQGIPMVQQGADDVSGQVRLIAQGEVAHPLPLKKLKSFSVSCATATGASTVLGPLTDQQIMRQFYQDCKARKAFFRDGGNVESTLLTAPYQVAVEDVLFRLVLDRDQVCLLGVCFAFTVHVDQVAVETECAVCLESCHSSEWACMQCRNLLHHSCVERVKAAGMTECPYCRYEF